MTKQEELLHDPAGARAISALDDLQDLTGPYQSVCGTLVGLVECSLGTFFTVVDEILLDEDDQAMLELASGETGVLGETLDR